MGDLTAVSCPVDGCILRTEFRLEQRKQARCFMGAVSKPILVAEAQYLTKIDFKEKGLFCYTVLGGTVYRSR